MFKVSVYFKNNDKIAEWDCGILPNDDLSELVRVLTKPSMYGKKDYSIRIETV